MLWEPTFGSLTHDPAVSGRWDDLDTVTPISVAARTPCHEEFDLWLLSSVASSEMRSFRLDRLFRVSCIHTLLVPIQNASHVLVIRLTPHSPLYLNPWILDHSHPRNHPPVLLC